MSTCGPSSVSWAAKLPSERASASSSVPEEFFRYTPLTTVYPLEEVGAVVWAGTPLSAKVRPSVREEAAEEGVSGDSGATGSGGSLVTPADSRAATVLRPASSRGDWASVITVTADRESRPKKSPSSQRSACWGRRLPCRSCWRAAAAESLPAVTAAAHRVSAASSRDRNRRIWICFIGITSQTSLCGEGGKDAGEKKDNFFQKSY